MNTRILLAAGAILGLCALAPSASAIEAAVMTSPPAGSQLPSTTVTFQWTNVGAASYYFQLYDASTYQTFFANYVYATSIQISNLPADGRRLTARIWTYDPSYGWQYRDVAYTAAGGSASAASMQSPPPGSTLTSSTQTFAWNASGASEYRIVVRVGGSVVYSASTGLATSWTVSGLPTAGESIQVELWSLLSAWVSNTYSYTAYRAPAAVQMTPVPGSTLAGSTVEFRWNDLGASYYYLNAMAGTSESRWIYSSGPACTVSGLPVDGRAVRVDLWSLVGGSWRTDRFDYTAATSSQTVPAASIYSPTDGSTLAESPVVFRWNDTGASQYRFSAGAYAGDTRYAAVQLGAGSTYWSLSNLPQDGSRVHVVLETWTGAAWEARSTSYVAGQRTVQPATLTGPASGSTLGAGSVTFTWTNTGASQYQLKVGRYPGTSEYGTYSGAGTSYTAASLPQDGSTVYARLSTWTGSAWQSNDYSFQAYRTSSAYITSPTPGSTLSSSSVTFTWTGGGNRYFLYVGSNQGNYDLGYYDGYSTSYTASLPTDGRTIHVWLQTYSGSTFIGDRTYTYKAAGSSGGSSTVAQMTSPAPDSTLSSSTVTFQWTAVSGAYYYLYVYDASGYRIAFRNTTATSATISGLPTDGSRLRVVLYTSTSSGTYPRTYYYTASSW